MRRKLCAVVGILAAFSFLSSMSAQQNGGLKLGEKLEGELGGKQLAMSMYVNSQGSDYVPEMNSPGQGFGTTIPVMLKAGQGVSVTATVTGQDRKVNLVLLDPDSKAIAYTKKGEVKTAQFDFPEVSVTGKYRILVFSDRRGPFVLRAIDPSKEESIEALESRIALLRKELAAAEAKLKALKEGSRSR